MRDVKIYVEGEVLELFEDETISIESSVQNVQDITLVFSDYTQSFTVPATPRNNAISEFFYDYDLDGVIDHNIRRSAFIEIDGIPFRTGKIQLEKSNIKNGLIESYTYGFFGSVTNLKDKIGDDKLKDLDFDFLNHTYSGTEIENRIKLSTDYDVRYPLISCDRVWQYNNLTTPADDISTIGGAIKYDELFPAVKNTAIFQAIQTKYGLTFTGNIFSNPNFKNTFLLFKNAETFTFWTEATKINFISETGYAGRTDLTNDTLTASYISINPATGQAVSNGSHTTTIQIYDTTTAANYAIDVYVNGLFSHSITGVGNNTYTVSTDLNSVGLSKVFSFKLRADAAISFKAKAVLKSTLQTQIGSVVSTTYVTTNALATTLMAVSTTINIGNYAPDMSVLEYIKGIFAQFNLTAYGTSSTSFIIEPLEEFYNRGTIYDITEYTTIENIDIERVPLYKRVSFNRQQSESFMNVEYKANFVKEYGDLSSEFAYDAGELKIELPFENLLFNKFEATNVQVGYTLGTEPDYKPLKTKPILLGLYATVSSNTFYLQKEASTVAVTSYAVFGQDTVNGATYSINFDAAQSTYLETIVPNSAYATYYQPYFQNLFNRKTRLTYVKCMFPIELMTIKLNDRVIIRDHRFIINNAKINMTTGEVDLVLINDYRALKNRPRIPIKTNGGTVLVSFPMPNSTKSATITDPEGYGVGIDIPTFTDDTTVEFTIPAMTNTERITEIGDTRLTEDGDTRITEDGDSTNIYLVVTYTYDDGTTEDEIIYIDYA